MNTDKLKKVGKLILTIIGSIITGIVSVLLFQNKTQKKDNEIEELKAELKKQEAKNEIEKKSADDIVDTYDNNKTVKSGIQQQKDEFREQIQHRLNEKLHG